MAAGVAGRGGAGLRGRGRAGARAGGGEVVVLLRGRTFALSERSGLTLLPARDQVLTPMTTPKATPVEVGGSEQPVPKALPIVPTPTVEQIHAMRASGRQLGDRIAEELAGLLTVAEDDLKMLLE